MIVTQQQHAVDTVALSPLHLREYKGPTSKNTLTHIALHVYFCSSQSEQPVPVERDTPTSPCFTVSSY